MYSSVAGSTFTLVSKQQSPPSIPRTFSSSHTATLNLLNYYLSEPLVTTLLLSVLTNLIILGSLQRILIIFVLLCLVISLSIMSSWFIHAVMCTKISVLFRAE